MRHYGRFGGRIRHMIRDRSREASTASIAHLGITYGAAVVLYGLGGWWLDRKLGTLPLFTLLGVALGAVGGFIWIYREVLRAEAHSRKKKEAGDDAEEK